MTQNDAWRDAKIRRDSRKEFHRFVNIFSKICLLGTHFTIFTVYLHKDTYQLRVHIL